MASKFQHNSTIVAQNQLVHWLNEVGMAEGHKKADLLRKSIELLLHQCSHMMPTCLEKVLSCVSDKSTDVKKIVVGFIEELSKNHSKYIPKIIAQLRLLVLDGVVAVQKRAIQAASIVYRNTLLWICKESGDMSDMKYVWNNLSELKLLVLNMIDSENEGIRTHSIKFLEEVVLLQSPSDSGEEDFSLDNLPGHLPFIDRHALEEESEHIFQLLVKFHNSQHISSVNLMACMTTLCLLAKFRPKYMYKVIQALGDLHTTLPPTLSQSQVNSVRKQLKMLLINLIKHPSSGEMIPQLAQLLADIGMSAQEINKVVPKDRRNKRLGDVKHGDTAAKRFRIDSPQSNSQGSDSNSRSDMITFDDDSSQGLLPKMQAATEDSIFEGLNNVDNVVNLVMDTLLNCLPDEMPSNFTGLYKPIPNSGTNIQKRHLANLMLSLIKNEPEVSPQATQVQAQQAPQAPVTDMAPKIPLLREEEEKMTLKNAVAKLQESSKADRQMESAVTKLMEETRQEHLKEEEKRSKDVEKPVPPQTPTVPRLKQKVKFLKLQELTRPIPKDIKEKLMIQAVQRILRAEKDAAIGGASQIRAKFVTIFASSYTIEIRDLVLEYILDDPVNRIDLGLSWLYEEYALMQGFNRHPVTLQSKMHEKHDQNYNQLLCALITQIAERGDPVMEASKDLLLRKIYSECPLVTEEAVDYLKHLVTEDKVAMLALELLEELCIMRPPRAHKYVTSLLCHILNDNEEIREVALKSAVKIYKRGTDSVRRVIEKHALLYLGFISLPTPPPEVMWRHTHVWTDDAYKLCLNLIMALFPENEELIVEVGRVYGSAGSEAKRVVLRAIEGPLRALEWSAPAPAACATPAGANPAAPPAMRPAAQALLNHCPKGAETLLTRLVHIMTEKEPPTPELVSRVRELYATRVSDVRFLIPVLTGLTKKEILAALPKLIKLNPAVVKEVFNKLLGLQNVHDERSPVSAVDLLVALHLIDPGTADLKYIIKATAFCFAEKQTYTQDVLSAVLQRLCQEREIPVLLMRTVLQALTLYPAMAPLVINILQLLVENEALSAVLQRLCQEREIPVLLMRTVLQALTLYPAMAPLVINILQLLVENEVWANKVAWEGWAKCCARLLPMSAAAAALLPHAAVPAVRASPALCAALREHSGLLPSHLVAAINQPDPQYPPQQMMPGSMMSAPMMPGSAMSVPMPVPMPVPPPNPMEPLPPGME